MAPPVTQAFRSVRLFHRKFAIFRRHRYITGVTDHALPHDFPIGIDPADIDFMGHVNNASYLKWVQDAVLSHWQKIAPAEAVASLLWVALKHEITYRKPTFLDDEVIATSCSRRSRARALSIRRSSIAARKCWPR